jgi:outer membrane protein, multidrug efflux system
VIRRNSQLLLAAAATVGLAGCDLAPPRVTPFVDVPSAYKEASPAPDGDGWGLANPQDAAPDGAWWRVFADPELDRLEDQVESANQNLQAAIARYDGARAEARIAKAAYYPTADAIGSASNDRLSKNVANPLPTQQFDNYALGLDLQYEVDVWGRVRNQARAGRDRAQAAAGDLASVDLSLHAELAADYFILRSDDAQQDILDRTVRDYRKALDLTQARHKVGYAAEPEVAAAEAQYKLAQTQDADIALQRAKLEHAIAILIGQAPARFSMPAAPLRSTPPALSLDLPATLLERRPDVAAAERRVAAANADIGVARAAYYPAINLSTLIGAATGGTGAAIFTAPATTWSVGPSGVLNLFDGGRRRGLNANARASYDEAVATYRQTVLDAFGQVEDSLVALRRLEEEASSQRDGVAAAQRSTTHANLLFQGGLSDYYSVVTAQNIELAAELTEAQIQGRRMVSSVLLVKALGGGWDAAKDKRFAGK